jgi:hypothetical protein
VGEIKMSIDDYISFDPKKGKLVPFPDGTLRWMGKLEEGYWLFDGTKMSDEDVKSMLFGMLDWNVPCIEPWNEE